MYCGTLAVCGLDRSSQAKVRVYCMVFVLPLRSDRTFAKMGRSHAGHPQPGLGPSEDRDTAGPPVPHRPTWTPA